MKGSLPSLVCCLIIWPSSLHTHAAAPVEIACAVICAAAAVLEVVLLLADRVRYLRPSGTGKLECKVIDRLQQMSNEPFPSSPRKPVGTLADEAR